MNSESSSHKPSGSGKKAKNTTVAGLVVAALIGGYTLLRPAINKATGLNLRPIAEYSLESGGSDKKGSNTASAGKTQSIDITKPSGTSSARNSSPPKQTTGAADRDSDRSKPSGTRSKTSERSSSSSSKPASSSSKPATTSADKERPSGRSSTTSPSSKTSTGSSSKSGTTSPKSGSNLKYGLLRDLGNERYISPVGLLYTPGSAEGHRLEHLKRHTADQPGRPGKHGVFDGGMEGALKTIDKAYEKAKAGSRTTKEVDRNRIIYTVDMGKRVGFVGGREGNQRRKPMARRVRLVLEGNRVITSFPL